MPDLVLSAFPWLSNTYTVSAAPFAVAQPYNGSEIPVNSYLVSEDTEGEF
jgi:hypothetical protein